MTEKLNKRNRVYHDGSLFPEYRVWIRMRERCNKISDPSYVKYGGRGIVVYEEWQSSFMAFLRDMGRRPSSNHSLDRIDNNGNYEPGNCRWATRKEQSNNRRNNIWVKWNGERKTVSQWAVTLGMKPMDLRYRLSSGWTFDEAVTIPIGGKRKKL